MIAHFESPVVYTHDGGHFLPTNAEANKQYLDFITKMLKSL